MTPEIPTPGRWMFHHPGEAIQGGKAEEPPRGVQAGRGGPGAFLEGPNPHDIARSLGIHLETLRNWAREDKARTQDADGGGDAGLSPAEKEELKRLRRENARLKEDNEILRKAAAYFARETTR
ncbi:transposase [Streptomyces sp. E5N91]|uniref:transposase n=1 Tax=Streptomyces sp. E5N91 TaxID=1851996 RepID=UPI0012915A35|nr:transposase [Streptomyces sp. E5N91]